MKNTVLHSISFFCSRPLASAAVLSWALSGPPALAVFPDPQNTAPVPEEAGEEASQSVGEGGGESSAAGRAAASRHLATQQAFRYGKGFIEAGIYGPAELQLEQVLQVLPGDAAANYYMGLAQIGLENPARAVGYLKTAIAADADYYAAYEQLGLLYLRQGDKAAARELSEALGEKVAACAADCEPLLSTAHESLRAALESGASAALDPASLLLNAQVDVDQTYMGAIRQINQGQYEKAIALLKQTAREIGPHPDLLTYQGFAHRKLQRYDEAIGYYRQALILAPAHKPANEYLGELYVEIGDLSRAALQLETLDELCPFSCAEREELARWIGLAQ